MTTPTLTADQVVAELRRRQGERAAAELARELGVSPQFLHDVLVGRRGIPATILEALGLEKIVVYQPIEKSA
jgi:hypothetical protein